MPFINPGRTYFREGERIFAKRLETHREQNKRTASPSHDGRRTLLEPASAPVPAAAENEQDENEDDEKCRLVHIGSPGMNKRSPAGPGFYITLGTWASGLTGGVGGTAPMPLKGKLGHVDLVPVAECSAYRNTASTRARASTSASVHAGCITRKEARRRMGRSGVSG